MLMLITGLLSLSLRPRLGLSAHTRAATASEPRPGLRAHSFARAAAPIASAQTEASTTGITTRLLALIAATDRGISADNRTRDEIGRLIGQLEASFVGVDALSPARSSQLLRNAEVHGRRRGHFLKAPSPDIDSRVCFSLTAHSPHSPPRYLVVVEQLRQYKTMMNLQRLSSLACEVVLPNR